MTQPLEPQELKNLQILISKALDGTIDCDEILLLEKTLKASGQARLHYRLYLTLYNDLECILKTDPCISRQVMGDDSVFDIHLWDKMAENEKNAPSVEVPKEEPKQKMVEKVVYEKVPSGVNKFSLATAIICAAALLFLLLVIRFNDLFSGPEVATLTDALNARWAHSDISLQVEGRLHVARKPLTLQEGLIELRFDNDARIVIEAPAEFRILADDRIDLQYGKIYATVPWEAIGFSIYTEHAKVIDLGTEFGIQAEENGDTELHVIRGRTMLIPGEKTGKISMEVSAGYAKRISRNTLDISDIPCDKARFIRVFDSGKQFVWKGQNQINLADILGGGNGFGTGRPGTGIDPATGKTSTSKFENRVAVNAYHPVLSNPFIDGVFIPNGRTEQVVSSLHHLFPKCPVTSGDFYTDILSTSAASGEEWVLTGFNNRGRVAPEGIPSRGDNRPRILMHANLGITFDLQAIRAMVPDLQVTRFRAQFGLTSFEEELFNADFRVLVDGQLKFEQTQVQVKGRVGSIDIALPETARFLTLITTDGGDPEGRPYNNQTITTIYGDWCVFVDPHLTLETK